jgi:hypothetical protein
MTLTSGGNLLVGTTTDAGFKLDVNGTGRFSGAVTGTQYNATLKYAWGSATNGTTGQIATDNTNNYFDYIGSLIFRGAAASNTLVTFSSTGAATFSSSVTASLFGVPDGGRIQSNGGTQSYYAPNSGASEIGYQGTLNFRAFNVGSPLSAMFLTSGGNVGIGTTTDQGAKLEVVGDSYLRTRVFTDTIRPYTGDQLQLLNGGNNFLFINGKLRITGLPTSSSGLSSGDVWNDSGTLKIV